jgi:hypothetical protein
MAARTIDYPPAGMTPTSLDPAIAADIKEADLFRGGRLGMGWSQTALARTLLVEEEMLQSGKVVHGRSRRKYWSGSECTLEDIMSPAMRP